MTATTSLLAQSSNSWPAEHQRPAEPGRAPHFHECGDEILDRHRVIITGTHPEYWTTPMLDALERWQLSGGRLIVMGGNGFYWRTGVHQSMPAAVEVRRAEDGTRAWIAEPGEYIITSGWHLPLTGFPTGGSITWAASLATNGYDNDVAKLTTNVLRRFADPEPIPAPLGVTEPRGLPRTNRIVA